jgi:hypothetical protein
MIVTTTASRIGGYYIAAHKGTAQGENFDEPLKSAEALGPNAILNTCFDDTLDVDTLFHGAAVVIERIPVPSIRSLPADSLFGPLQQAPEGHGDIAGPLTGRLCDSHDQVW